MERLYVRRHKRSFHCEAIYLRLGNFQKVRESKNIARASLDKEGFLLTDNILIYEQNNRTNMRKYTERYEVKLTKEVSNTLEELRNRKIVVSKFIRLAIEEKAAT